MIEHIDTFVARDGFVLRQRSSLPAVGVRAVASDDPLPADVEGVPAQFLAEIANATAAIVAALDRVAVPLLVLHGSADTMADPAISAELVARAASTDKTLHVIPDGYHALLRDVDRVEVESRIIDWIDARLPTRR